MSSTNSNLTAEGKKYISLIELAQASGNAKEVYSLANQLIQSDIEAPEGYYYKAITTTSMKEGWVLAERLVKISPLEAKYYLDVAEHIGRLYANAYKSEVDSMTRQIELAKKMRPDGIGTVEKQWNITRAMWKEFAPRALVVLEGFSKCISFLDPIIKKENPSGNLAFSEEDTKKAYELAKNLVRQIISVINYSLDGIGTGICHQNDCYEDIILCDDKQQTTLQEYYIKYINFFGDFSVEDCLAASKKAKRPAIARFFAEQAIKLHPSEYKCYCVGAERVAELYLKEFQSENAFIDSLAEVERDKLGTDEEPEWEEVTDLWNKFVKRAIDKIEKIGDFAMILPPLLSQKTISAEDRAKIETAKNSIAEKINKMTNVLIEGCKKNIFSAIHCKKEDNVRLKTILEKYASALGIQAKVKEKKKGGCLSTIFKLIFYIILIGVIICVVLGVIGIIGSQAK